MTGEPYRISTLAGWADMDAKAHMGRQGITVAEFESLPSSVRT